MLTSFTLKFDVTRGFDHMRLQGSGPIFDVADKKPTVTARKIQKFPRGSCAHILCG
jgi:hypothetical protein